MKIDIRSGSRVALALVMLGALAFPMIRVSEGVECGAGVGCRIDINCEVIAGSTCLNVGGLQTCSTCEKGYWYPLTEECGQKLVGTLTVCVIPAGRCGGMQCILDAYNC